VEVEDGDDVGFMVWGGEMTLVGKKDLSTAALPLPTSRLSLFTQESRHLDPYHFLEPTGPPIFSARPLLGPLTTYLARLDGFLPGSDLRYMMGRGYGIFHVSGLRAEH
jgi:hypothetical protein